jgi:hypothetical protein
MLIKVSSVDKVTKRSAAGKPYKAIEVRYESDGRATTYTLFNNDPLAGRVLELRSGSNYNVKVVKDGDYFKWSSIEDAETPKTVSEPDKTPSRASTPGSTYSTKEERDDTQRRIVRQFAINASISLLKTDKRTPEPKEIKALAEEFVDFVYEADQHEELARKAHQAVADIDDDIPY